MQPPASLSSWQRRALLLLGAALLLVSGWRFDGPSRGYWDTYITVPAMFMAGQRVELTRIDGSPRFDYELSGRIPDDTYDPRPGSFGIASEDQRIGTCILFSAPFALFALAAFRWGYAATWVLLFGASFAALRRLLLAWRGRDGAAPPGAGFALPLAGALFLVANPFSLYLERLNGNLFGLAFLVLLWALLCEERPSWWLCGLVYGVIGGIRNEAIVLGPVVLGLLARDRPGWRAFGGRLLAFTAAAFVAILPVLLWNRFAYGQMIVHPSQVAHLEGFRPTFAHRWFGLGEPFQFNGLLNWPFHDRVVRTPHFAFPTFLHWPLVTVKSLGLVLAPAALIGAVVLPRRLRLPGLLLWGWYLAFALLFAFQENWEELKQTFMALHLFPLAAFLVAGLAWIAEGWRRPGRWVSWGALALLLGGTLLGLRQLRVPVDERWYERFPHADRNESGLAGLPVPLRKDWQFFYTRESAAEIEQERLHMTAPRLWPAPYRPVHWPGTEELPRILAEPRTRTLRTLAVWSYIYE